MPLTKRGGSTSDIVSIRVSSTELGSAASALLETNTRPVLVAAQSVELSVVARSFAATIPPARSPSVSDVSRPFVDGSPSGCQSPQVPCWSPVNSLQCWRSSLTDIEPSPKVCVRQTCSSPAYIVPLTTG